MAVAECFHRTAVHAVVRGGSGVRVGNRGVIGGVERVKKRPVVTDGADVRSLGVGPPGDIVGMSSRTAGVAVYRDRDEEGGFAVRDIPTFVDFVVIIHRRFSCGKRGQSLGKSLHFSPGVYVIRS